MKENILSPDIKNIIDELAEFSSEKIKLETTKSMVLSMYKGSHLTKEETVKILIEICQKLLILDSEQFRLVLDEETINEIAENMGVF